MKYTLPKAIRANLRKIDWLARLYRKYVIKMPFDHELQARG